MVSTGCNVIRQALNWSPMRIAPEWRLITLDNVTKVPSSLMDNDLCLSIGPFCWEVNRSSEKRDVISLK